VCSLKEDEKFFFFKVQNISFMCWSLKKETRLGIGDDDGHRLGIFDSEIVKEKKKEKEIA
jgi:hypothetical protein